MALTEEDKQWIEELFNRSAERVIGLITGVKESLEREIAEVNETVGRMEVRLGKIAAGAHYVSRLVEWSESQDAFQTDILRRVQALERKLEEPHGKA